MDLEKISFLPERNLTNNVELTSYRHTCSRHGLLQRRDSGCRDCTVGTGQIITNHSSIDNSSGDIGNNDAVNNSSNLSSSSSPSACSTVQTFSPASPLSNLTSVISINSDSQQQIATAPLIEDQTSPANDTMTAIITASSAQHSHSVTEQNHSVPSFHHTNRIPPLPSRSPYGNRRSRWWCPIFLRCNNLPTSPTTVGSSSSSSTSTNANQNTDLASSDYTTERVLYHRSPADGDSDSLFQVTTAPMENGSNATLSSCICNRPLYYILRKYLIKILLIIFMVMLIAAMLESLHLVANRCNNSSSRHLSSSFSTLSHPLERGDDSALEDLVMSAVPKESLYQQKSQQSVEGLMPSAATIPPEIDNFLSDESCVDSQGKPFLWDNIRLPTFIKPINYELFMSPNLTTFYNTGNISIELEIVGNYSQNFLVIHSKKLNITRVSIVRIQDEFQLKVVRLQECPRLEQLYIEVNVNMTADFVYQLSIQFERQLEDQLEGFYISSYYNTKHEEKRYLLTTHFEPTLARTAFPCFDEPAIKAAFSLKLLHDSAYQAYFNTRIISDNEIEVDGVTRNLAVFERSVPMSTYLVAFVLCDFGITKTTSDMGIQIQAIAPVGQAANTKYALMAASKILSYFQNFFKVPYPLRKLDLVAVPDFAAGAMENWGLITFRTSTLLFDDNESNAETQEQIATVIAHEIAHQWFGNLVTMNWWNDLWLNEGFASYVENLGVDFIHPEWRMLDQFVISTSQQALALDSLVSSHSIYTTVANPAEIEAIFDMISYKKGSCLIRMIESFLGTENLQLGLEKYLNRYKFATATTSQLWECFSEVSVSLPVDVSAIMETWIFQQGYPVISARWDKDQRHIVVSQRRFISSMGLDEYELALLKNGTNSTNFTQNWIVPLTIVSESQAQFKLYWLNSDSMNIPLKRSENRWFKLNHLQSGFYRVNYETSIWRDLIRELVSTNPTQHRLSASDRAGLIDDALSLMRIGYLDVNTAMDLSRYIEFGERDYVPWETVLNHFGIIDALMLQHPMLHRYIRRMLRSLADRLSWTEKSTDDMFEKKLRSIILRSAVFYGDKEAIATSSEYFRSWINDQQKIPANIRDIVYNAGAQFGDDAEWYHCWNTYLNTTIASEKRLLLGALGSTRNHYLLSVYLSASLNRDQVRTQDTTFVIQSVARNPIGRDMAWKFVRANWNTILNLFGQGSFSIESIISETTWHFFTEFEYREIEQFFASVDVGPGKQAVHQSLEKIRANIYWKQHIEHKVIRWLTQVNSESDI